MKDKYCNPNKDGKTTTEGQKNDSKVTQHHNKEKQNDYQQHHKVVFVSLRFQVLWLSCKMWFKCITSFCLFQSGALASVQEGLGGLLCLCAQGPNASCSTHGSLYRF